MEKKLNSYETLFVIDATLNEEAVRAMVEKFSALIAAEGTVEQVNEWGKRRLAYPINDMNDGYYVNIVFKGVPSLPAELERVFGITDGILRSVVVRVDEKRAAKAAAAAATAAAAAAAAAEKAVAVESEATDAE